MPTIAEIRRGNLLALVAAFGSMQALADAVSKSHSQLTQLKGKHAHSTSGVPRAMGDKVAADIATALGVEVGWMDTLQAPEEVERSVDRWRRRSIGAQPRAAAAADPAASEPAAEPDRSELVSQMIGDVDPGAAVRRALDVLGEVLESEMPPDDREEAAVALAQLARGKGHARYRALLVDLLAPKPALLKKLTGPAFTPPALPGTSTGSDDAPGVQPTGTHRALS